VIPGRCEASNPESRDSGLASSRRPGTTAYDNASLPRHRGLADRLSVEFLDLVHDHGHARQPPGEFERRLVMRHRAAAIAAPVGPRPRNQRVEGELAGKPTCRLAIDQERVFAESRTRALGWLGRTHEPVDANAEPVRAGADLAIGGHDLMAAAD